MEFASRTVCMISLMGRYDNIVKFFTRVQNIACCASALGPEMLRLELLRLRISRWADDVGLSGNVANLHGLRARAESRRYIFHAKETLDEAIAKVVRDREVEHEVANQSKKDSVDREILIQRLRSVSNSRLCNSNTLSKGRWFLKFDRFCHRSFRRQCELSIAQDKWIVHVYGDLDKLTKDLTVSVKDLELGLESSCSNSHAHISPSCDYEVRQLLRHLLSPAQITFLKDSTTFPDVPLEEAILREEKSVGEPQVQSNDEALLVPVCGSTRVFASRSFATKMTV
ncbi:hypothetical protein Q7P35_006798 [Cladosporium inversicolor]